MLSDTVWISPIIEIDSNVRRVEVNKLDTRVSFRTPVSLGPGRNPSWTAEYTNALDAGDEGP